MIIQSKKVWIAGQFLPAQIHIVEGKIQKIDGYKKEKADVDYGDKRIVPGFIDIHTHGAYGFDTNDGEEVGLRHWMAHIPEEGVTAILPTTVTQMPEVLTRALKNVAKVVKEGYEGAEILGVHFEGPYLDMDYKGAQPPEAIAKPTVEQFEVYQRAAEGLIRYITLAPEHDTDFVLTKYCREHGVVVSMGHSSASYEQALLGIANGATSMTHVYNGMTPYHHRNPGLVGCALRVRDIYGEVIGDGHHSHPASLNNYFQAKGKDYTILITDSLCVKGADKSKDYQLGGHDIELSKEGLALLKGTNTIAGSILRMNQGLRILVEEAMVPFDAALAACTINPARCLGIENRKGKIVSGNDADLVVLEENYEVCQTYCRGRAMLPINR